MITKYRIYEDDKEIVLASSSEEANTCVECLQAQNPHKEYKIEEIQVSAVKPGFGRDPDLH
jgi:hypothetical protein